MTKSNGLPCQRCGTNDWDKNRHCKECQRRHYRKWRQANPEKEAERNRQWNRENPERAADKSRRYRQANRDREAERNRIYRQENLERDAAKSHRRRTRKTQAGGAYTAEEFKVLCAHYGNKCLRCGRTGVKLTADHILPVVRGGTSNIENIQPLCFSCNSSKQDKHIDYRPDAGPLRWLQAKLFG